MKEKLNALLDQAKADISGVKGLKDLEDLRIKYLGKKGEVTLVLKNMKDLSQEERPLVGKIANDIREKIELLIDTVKENKKSHEIEMQLERESIDVTMPSKNIVRGHKHPINVALDEIMEIFLGMGFKIAEGPEVETVYNNFDALNAPIDHPSRSLSDTFYKIGRASCRERV